MGIRAETLGLIVDDMKTSLAFYRLLGLDIPAEADTEDHVELGGNEPGKSGEGGLGLAWDTAAVIRQLDPDWSGATGKVGVAFRCDTPEEVNERYARLADLGYGHNAPWDAFWGQRYARLRDPDGNRIELFAALPGDPEA